MVTLIQRFGPAANLNVHLHCLVLDGVYRHTLGEPVFFEVAPPSDEAVQAVLHEISRRSEQPVFEKSLTHLSLQGRARPGHVIG